MTAMRSDMARASSWSCVTYTNVVCRARAGSCFSSSCMFFAKLEVEGAERLVEQERGRLDDQGARQGDTLLLTARELPGHRPRNDFEPNRASRLRTRDRRSRYALTLDLETEGDVGVDRQVREQRVLLEDHVHGRRIGASTLVTSSPVQQDRDPASGCSNPAIIRSVVVLPQPDGPSSEKNSPSSIATESSDTAAACPKCLLTPSNAIATGRECSIAAESRERPSR